MLATSPLAAMRSAPTITASTSPRAIRWPAMLSAMSVVGMPSLDSSQAVSRAPWRYGRVSSAQHVLDLALPRRGADHAQRRAVARGGQSARVAVGEHARARPGSARPPGRPCGGRPPRPPPGWPAPPRAARPAGPGRPWPRRVSKRRRMRSMAQKRLTAVGRVAAISAQMRVELGPQGLALRAASRGRPARCPAPRPPRWPGPRARPCRGWPTRPRGGRGSGGRPPRAGSRRWSISTTVASSPRHRGDHRLLREPPHRTPRPGSRRFDGPWGRA